MPKQKIRWLLIWRIVMLPWAASCIYIAFTTESKGAALLNAFSAGALVMLWVNYFTFGRLEKTLDRAMETLEKAMTFNISLVEGRISLSWFEEKDDESAKTH